MDSSEALEVVRQNKGRGTLATLNPDGSPHLAVALAAIVDGKLWISTPVTTVKARNVERDPRATMSFGIRPWIALTGRATVLREDLPAKLRHYYRTAAGEHPDWDDYDRAMILEKRVILEITPERAYGS